MEATWRYLKDLKDKNRQEDWSSDSSTNLNKETGHISKWTIWNTQLNTLLSARTKYTCDSLPCDLISPHEI